VSASFAGSRVLSRWQAAGIHLGIVLLLAMLLALLVFGVWYPQPYRAAAGADRLMLLLIGFGLLPGPLLMLIVYRHGKKGMLFDVVFIAAVQLAAMSYGLFVIAQARPAFIVVSQGMTFLTTAGSIENADLAIGQSARFRSRSWSGPVQVAALPPDDAKGREQLLNSGLAGKDIDRLPWHYRAMEEAGAQLIADSAPFRHLAEHPETRAAARLFVADSGMQIEQLRFQPLRGRDPEKDTAIIYAVGRLSPVGVIDIDPWPALN
jgi:hypothetical protein